MSYLEGSIVIFFDGAFRDENSFDKGKRILEKLIINKLMIPNKEILNADISSGDFFKIKKITDKFAYSSNIQHEDIITLAINSFSSGKISTRLRKKENINLFLISDLSSFSATHEQIRNFGICMTNFMLNVYLFSDKLNEQSHDSSSVLNFLLQSIPQERCFSFDKGENFIKYFAAPNVRAANAKINFEIDNDYFIPLCGYVNQIKISDKFNITKVTAEQIDKPLKRVYVYKNEGGGKIESDCVIDAYRYGSQLIPFNFFDQLYHSMEPGTKSLKLLQFAPRSDIDLSYLEPPVYHYFIDKSDTILANRGEALIKSMIERDVVGVASRIISKNSKPKLVIMFPGICKDTSEPVLITFISVYRESLKSIDIPSGEKVIKSLTTDEMSLMDSYIDAMMLESDDNRYKPEHTPDPFYQNKLSVIVAKAMEEDYYDKSYIEDILNLDTEKVDKTKDIEKKLSNYYKP